MQASAPSGKSKSFPPNTDHLRAASNARHRASTCTSSPNADSSTLRRSVTRQKSAIVPSTMPPTRSWQALGKSGATPICRRLSSSRCSTTPRHSPTQTTSCMCAAGNGARRAALSRQRIGSLSCSWSSRRCASGILRLTRRCSATSYCRGRTSSQAGTARRSKWTR